MVTQGARMDLAEADAVLEVGPADPRLPMLLAKARLARDDLGAARFLAVPGPGGALLACGGIEACGGAALLRSLAVAPDARGRGLGQALVERLLEMARKGGAEEAFLLTAGAAPWFERLGFAEVPRTEVPPAVAATGQFRGSACAAARAMRRALV